MRLKMNPSKTEYIYFGNSWQLKKCSEKDIDIAGDLIVRSSTIHYLGVWMDEALNFREHVTRKCPSSHAKSLKIKINKTSVRHQNISQLMSKSMYVTCRLLQFCVVWTPSSHHKQITASPEHVCMLSLKKRQI